MGGREGWVIDEVGPKKGNIELKDKDQQID